MDWQDFDALIDAALAEDVVREDVTTLPLVPADRQATARLEARATGVICGLPLAKRLVERFDAGLRFVPSAADGERVEPGQILALLSGPAGRILTVERTMLNFLQRLSGVATIARSYVDRIQGTGARILDTRKTTPGWRHLEKYAVRCGGATNHRMDLRHEALIKDNHLALMGATPDDPEGVGLAVERVRAIYPDLAVEVEVESLAQLEAALPAAPDVVLLDNMTPDGVREAVALTDRLCAGGRRPQLEASGGITIDNVREFALAGADRISIGALTHSAVALDLALEIELDD